MESHHNARSRMTIDIVQRQAAIRIQTASWRQRLVQLLAEEGYSAGEVSVAVVDESEMLALNRQYLQHDYHTDVLSFVLERGDGYLEGEIIVSADMATERAGEFGWSADQELGLYLIHGALHLAGYLDKSPAERVTMRARERYYLALFELGDAANGPSRGACSS